jgi:surface polysaccharide O-acyltransferase-like enzyme
VVLHKPIDPMRIARDLMLAKTYTALYFFPLIIGLYVITPILRPFFARATRREAWLAGGLILAGCLAYPVIGLVAALQKVGVVNAPLNALTYFLPSVGIYIAGYLLRDVRLSRRGVVLAAAAVATAGTELVWQDLHPHMLHGWLDALMPPGMDGVQCTVVSLGLFVLARTLIRPGTRLASPAAARRARVLGDLTLGVFVIHLTVRHIVQHTVPGWIDGGTTIPSALALTGVVLVGAFAVAWAFMKTPVLRKTIGG